MCGGCRRWLVVTRDTRHPCGHRRRLADAAEERRDDRPIACPPAARSSAPRPLRFTFDGRPDDGLCRRHARLGAARQRRMLVGRSFKYHRPRGILTAGSEEPNALVDPAHAAGGASRTRGATVRSSIDGLKRSARTAGRRSRFDSARSTACCRRSSAPASTTRPSCGRRASGRRSTSPHPPRRRPRPCGYEADPDRYDKAWAHCDVLVIGAGPAGLAAALAAGRAGARVILVDEDFAPGGTLLADDRADRRRCRRRLRATASRPSWRRCPNVRVLTAHHGVRLVRRDVFGAVERVHEACGGAAQHRPRQRLWRIVAKRACSRPAR